MEDSATNSDVLNSWKEVALYLGRGVRTVQRWEQELGLPVHRPRGRTRSAVIAFRSELDVWLHGSRGTQADPLLTEMPGSKNKLHGKTSQLIVRTQELVNRSTELCERMKDTQDQINRALELASTRVRRNLELRNAHPRQTESRLAE